MPMQFIKNNMRHFNKIWRFGLVFGLATLPQVNEASVNQQDTMWIVGFYVNVHDGTDDKSRVVDHLITNSQVRLTSENGRYCGISWGSGRQGYVVCRYLAQKPLTLGDVERTGPVATDDHFEGSPLRAFWIEPSYQRLRAAGAFFEKSMLSAAAVKKEAAQLNGWVTTQWTTNRPDEQLYFTRFSVPEFDAMKAMASSGIKPPRLTEPVYPNVRKLLTKPEGSPMPDEHLPLLKYLPSVRTSRFGSPEEVGGMQATTDWLSALFQIPYKVEVVGKPYAVSPKYNDPYIFGSWDVGDVKLSLVRPVHDVGIYLDGHVNVRETHLNEQDGYYPDFEATAECGSFMIDAHLRNEANVPYIVTQLPAKDILLYFRTPTAIDISTAQIKKKVLKLNRASNESRDIQQVTGGPAIKEIVQYSITLNGDASPDFIVFEVLGLTGSMPGPDSDEAAMLPIARYYFVNIGAEWKLMESDTLQECS